MVLLMDVRFFSVEAEHEHAGLTDYIDEDDDYIDKDIAFIDEDIAIAR